MKLDRSRELWKRAQAVIPLGTQTLSKSPTQFVQGVTPVYLARGSGAHVWDVDGNEFIDYPMALGPVILGYAEPAVDEAIRRQLADGISFTLMHPLEVEVAERITSMCPGVEQVRFMKSGSEALSAAVRAARAQTGRDRIVVTGYHGWHDWFIGSTTRCAGVPAVVRDLVVPIPFNDLDALDAVLAHAADSVAAVVVEPVTHVTPSGEYLSELISRSEKHGIISVFDEVITGFRVAPGGARELYGVEPALSCYGKALGNGMPISAVGGSREMMKIFDEIFVSGTHGGETLSLAAARAVLDEISDGSLLEQIARRGQRLQTDFSRIVDQYGVGNRVMVSGHPSRTCVTFRGPDPLITRSWIQQCMIDAGILFNGSMFISARHCDADVARAVRAFDQACRALGAENDVESLLRGKPVEPVFRSP